MRTITRVAVLACATTIVGVGPSFAQVLDPNMYYRLSTQFRSTNSALDVFNGGPQNNFTHLAPIQDVSGQFWRFTPNDDGTYAMTTEFRGSGQCLDIFYGGENNDEPHLTACGNFSGQQWMVVLDGQCRLTTKFHGDGMCLDVFSSGPKVDQPHLSSCGNFSGQHWQLSPAKPAPAPAK
jgi:Ricin-type beta-trefoil lectin domain